MVPTERLRVDVYVQSEGSNGERRTFFLQKVQKVLFHAKKLYLYLTF